MENLEPAFEEIGAALRLRRKELGLTLREIADQTGLSVGFISQLERGMTAPSLSSLYSLARALRAPVTSFFKQGERAPGITREDGRVTFSMGGPLYEQMTTHFPGSMLRGLIVHYPPGMEGEESRHAGEELMVVIRGALEVELEGRVKKLGEGDSLHFSSRRPHRVRNGADQMTTILWCGTWDVFSDTPTDPNHDTKTDAA